MKVQYREHPSLYILDGNIAIIAHQSVQECVVFRVHRSMLSRFSAVFDTMMTLPATNASTNENYDGVPAVCMTDPADQIESLLKFMYHEIRLPSQERDPHKMQALRHVLELTDKYAMDDLRQDIIADVERIWPSTLYQWDTADMHVQVRMQAMRRNLYDELDRELHQFDDLYPEPATAIQLARSCNVPRILPAAFYHLSRISPYNDWDEIHHSKDILHHGQQSALWMQLSAQDFLCLFKGKQKLQGVARDVLCLRDCPDCCSFPCHRSSFIDQLREACKSSADILHTARLYIDKADQGDGLCAACAFDIFHKLINFRQQLWKKLPEIFSLV